MAEKSTEKPTVALQSQPADTTMPQEGQAIVGQGQGQRAASSAKKRQRESQRRFLEALPKAQGNISLAAQLAAIDRDIHYSWLHGNKEYAERFERARKASKQARVDMALARVMEKVARSEDKDTFAAAKLVLENEGQEYGYGQKPGTNVQVNTQVNSQQNNEPTITIDQWRTMAKKAVEPERKEE